jgi:purine-binding chemotaxis protein CheW
MDIAQALGTDIASTVTSDACQYLTFFLADAEYGVDILRVQEIKGWETVTALPNTPE